MKICGYFRIFIILEGTLFEGISVDIFELHPTAGFWLGSPPQLTTGIPMLPLAPPRNSQPYEEILHHHDPFSLRIRVSPKNPGFPPTNPRTPGDGIF